MNRLFLIATFTALSFFFGSFSLNKTEFFFKISINTFAKGIDSEESYTLPADPIDTFNIHNAEVISHIEFVNLSGSLEPIQKRHVANNNLCSVSNGHFTGKVNISGKWNSGHGMTYYIIQNGKIFSWTTITNKGPEKGVGKINGKNVKAFWNGGYSDSANGHIIRIDKDRATRIKWNNGAVFFRE